MPCIWRFGDCGSFVGGGGGLTCAGSRAVQDQLLRVVVPVCMHVVHVDQTGESLLDCDCQFKRHFELTVPLDPVRIFTLNPWPIDSLGTLDGRTL